MQNRKDLTIILIQSACEHEEKQSVRGVLIKSCHQSSGIGQPFSDMSVGSFGQADRPLSAPSDSSNASLGSTKTNSSLVKPP